MKRRRAFTLLEVMIAIALLGFLLTELFHCLQSGLKKGIEARQLKQKVLQVELFQERLKNLFSHFRNDETELTLENHSDAKGKALLFTYNQEIDPDVEMQGTIQSMLYLNGKQELCLASWSEAGKARMETLLDKIDGFECRLFDAKKAEWIDEDEEEPVMVKIDLKWEGETMPFVFFLGEAQPIKYPYTP
jgi:prepilin-type N-terminal cleavage/methylation domain-containing protein